MWASLSSNVTNMFRHASETRSAYIDARFLQRILEVDFGCPEAPVADGSNGSTGCHHRRLCCEEGPNAQNRSLFCTESILVSS
jgi:hypothetical protein